MALAIALTPTAPVLTPAEFRAHARLGDETTEDAVIAGMIAAVTYWLAGPQGWLGRSLVQQTLSLITPLGVAGWYPGGSEPIATAGMMGLVLPRPPFLDVQSVAILDATGAAVIVPPVGYATHDGPDGLTRLTFTSDFRAPVLPAGAAFLRTVYRAGYGPKGEDVDPGIRHAMLMAVMRLYAGRGDPTMTLQSDPMTAELFAPYRVWSTL